MPDRKYEIQLVVDERVGRSPAETDQLISKITRAKEALDKSADNLGSGLGRADAALSNMLMRATSLGTVFGGLVATAKAINDAIREADERQRNWAKESNRGQVNLVQLAGVMSEQPGQQFQREHAAFSTATGLGDRALAFREQFWGRAAQNVGKEAAVSRTMSVAHGKDFERRAAEIAVQTGIEPGVVGDLAGAVASRTDWDKQHGENAPEEAALQLRRMLAVIQIGAGGNKILVSQLTRSMAELVRRDRRRGIVQDPVELAGMISAMAERNPAAASVYLDRAAETGLFDFDDPKAGPILKKSGVQHGDALPNAAAKIGTYLDPKLKRGQTIEQYLLAHGWENRQAIAIGGLIDANRSGLLAQRRGVAAQITPESMQAEREAMATDHVAQVQQVEAAEREAEVLRGQETGRVEVARQAMKAQMLRNRQVATTNTAVALGMFNSGFNPATWLGYRATEEAVVDVELSARLARQSGIPGIGFTDSFNPAGRTEHLRRQVAAIEGHGQNISDILPIFRSIDESLKVLRRQAERPAGGNVPQVPQQGGMPRP